MLIMGVGAQLPMWPDGFCAQLIEAGLPGDPVRSPRHRAVDEDARNTRHRVGLHRVSRYLLGRTSPVPYTLVDLAEDVSALLDHLGIARAHVVGASMGGMIAQVLAGSHPDRVPDAGHGDDQHGKPFSSVPRWRVIRLAFNSPAKDAPSEERLAYEVRNIAVINGPNFLPPDDQLRHRVQELTARSDYPQGMLRQFDASWAPAA